MSVGIDKEYVLMQIRRKIRNYNRFVDKVIKPLEVVQYELEDLISNPERYNPEETDKILKKAGKFYSSLGNLKEPYISARTWANVYSNFFDSELPFKLEEKIDEMRQEVDSVSVKLDEINGKRLRLLVGNCNT